MNAAVPASCPYCGAANPSRLGRCPLCFRQLPRADALGAEPSNDPLYARGGLWSGPVGPLGAVLGRAGLLWVSLGIASAVVGVVFLVAGSFVRLVGSSINQACAGSAVCLPSRELTVIFWAAGAAGIILGIVLIALGIHRSMGRSSWLTLPP